MNTILFSMDPEMTCLIVSDQMSEEELQGIRNKFPRHKIVSCCSNHSPAIGAFMAPIEALDNPPPCAIILTPDEDWKMP